MNQKPQTKIERILQAARLAGLRREEKWQPPRRPCPVRIEAHRQFPLSEQQVGILRSLLEALGFDGLTIDTGDTPPPVVDTKAKPTRVEIHADLGANFVPTGLGVAGLELDLAFRGFENAKVYFGDGPAARPPASEAVRLAALLACCDRRLLELHNMLGDVRVAVASYPEPHS